MQQTYIFQVIGRIRPSLLNMHKQKRFYTRETKPRNIVKLNKCPSYPFTFYATQITNPFLS